MILNINNLIMSNKNARHFAGAFLLNLKDLYLTSELLTGTSVGTPGSLSVAVS